MKRIILFLAFIPFFISLYAQSSGDKDLIYKCDYELVEAKILEVSSKEVKYKEWNNQDGPTFVLTADEIGKIQFSNGTIKAYNTATAHTVVQTSSEPIYTNTQSSSDLSKVGFQFNLDFGGHFTSYKPQHTSEMSFDGFSSGGINFTFGAGARIKKYLYVGATLDITGEFGSTKATISGIGSGPINVSTCYMPIYLDARAYLPNKTRCYPFFEVGLGGYIGISSMVTMNLSSMNMGVKSVSVKVDNGFFFTTGLGLEFKYYTMGVGYRLFHVQNSNGNYGYIKIGCSLGRPAKLKSQFTKLKYEPKQ